MTMTTGQMSKIARLNQLASNLQQSEELYAVTALPFGNENEITAQVFRPLVPAANGYGYQEETRFALEIAKILLRDDASRVEKHPDGGWRAYRDGSDGSIACLGQLTILPIPVPKSPF